MPLAGQVGVQLGADEAGGTCYADFQISLRACLRIKPSFPMLREFHSHQGRAHAG